MTAPRKKPPFPELVAFRAPVTMSDAVGWAADRRRTSVSEYVRQAVLTSLRAEGLALPAIPLSPETTGALQAGGKDAV